MRSGASAALRGARSSLPASLASRKALQTRLEQQQAVARLGQLALTDVPRQELLDEACRVVAAELRTDFAAILEVRPDRGALVVRANAGWPEEHLGHVPAGPRSHGGYTLTANRPVIMRDAAHETRFELSPQMIAQAVTSGVTACIGSDGETYGVLGAHTTKRRDFSDYDVTFLEAVGSVLASALLRRAAEDEAEQTQRVLGAVIDGTTEDVFVKDLDGRFIALNAMAAETLGRPREELIGRTIHDVMPRRIADTMTETDRLILERGTVETFEETVMVGDEERVVLTTKGPYRARDGTLLGTFGIGRDITERKTQERELARSEERFRLAQEGARMGTWDVDLATGVTTWSEGLRALYGVGPDHPAGFDHVAPLVHPDDRERVTHGVTDAYTRGLDHEFECRIVRPDGELRWVLARLTSRRGEDGAVSRILGIAVDITERKLAEEDLVRSVETLRLAQSAAGLGAWDWNVDTGELRWAPEVYEIFGLDPASYVPTYETMFDYIHPDDRKTLEGEVRRAFASGEAYYECPCRVVQPSGDTRWVNNRGTVIRNADGTPMRLIGVILDETVRKTAEAERVQLENRLRQAEKLEAVGQLAGGVAHDFNNLLVAIRGYGELALGRLSRGEDGVAAHLESVLEASDRATVLTKQLLAVGRRQVLNPEVLDLNEVVRTTDGLLQRLIGGNVRLVATLAEQPVVVKADRGQLEQVIMNLAINGRDANPGGVLTIRVATGDPELAGNGTAPRHAVLSVTDEGSGIDAATASHIFEPFFTTKGEEGTGLGLATVHGIVAQSGGQIVLDTEPGRGTTFSVYLPLCVEEMSSLRTAPETLSAGGTETVLLVEDDPAVRAIMSTMLSARGYDMLDAADGEEAIVRFNAHERPIQLIISDLNMRGLDGRQTVERIRGIEPGTKVLYMSGYTDDAIILSGGLRPGTGFIQKPFSGDELATCVRELLDGVAA